MEIMLKCWLQNFTVCSVVLFYFLGWESSEINVCLFCLFVCLSVCLFAVVVFLFRFILLSL